jgi:hypothetical protein
MVDWTHGHPTGYSAIATVRYESIGKANQLSIPHKHKKEQTKQCNETPTDYRRDVIVFESHTPFLLLVSNSRTYNKLKARLAKPSTAS